MVADLARARSRRQDGAWVKMAEGREWLFPTPPAPGVDEEYDGLARGLLEAEDRSEAKKFELAMAILLLSRTYRPSPREYQQILYFGTYDAERSFHEAISTLIRTNLRSERRHAALGRSASSSLPVRKRALRTFISNCAVHFRSTLAPWLH